MGWKDWATLGVNVGLGTKAGELFNNLVGTDPSKKSYKRQKEFAQNALQWRVADATAAGLHPLAALGMPLAGYSDTVGSSGEGSLQDTLSSMGADVTRAMTANADPLSKVSAQYEALQLENASLQNDKLRSEIAIMNQAGTPPGVVRTPQGQWAVSPEAPEAYKIASKAYGDETAEWGVGMPWMAYDLLRQPGNILDSGNVTQARAGVAEAKATLDAAIATLQQWYRPGGWNDYWR